LQTLLKLLEASSLLAVFYFVWDGHIKEDEDGGKIGEYKEM